MIAIQRNALRFKIFFPRLIECAPEHVFVIGVPAISNLLDRQKGKWIPASKHQSLDRWLGRFDRAFNRLSVATAPKADCTEKAGESWKYFGRVHDVHDYGPSIF